MSLLDRIGEIARPPAWTEQAMCAGTDPEAFFPEKGGSTREAKRVCRSCRVRAECLTDALEKQERFGVRGGLSERERRKLLALQGIELQADDEEDEEPKGTAA